jgi:dienelactone hydrolase
MRAPVPLPIHAIRAVAVLFWMSQCLAATPGERLAPFMSPLAEFVTERAPLRSPLLFDDGRRVRSSADWAERRAEIKSQWMRLLGEWPAQLEKARMETIMQTEEPLYVRRRVRVEIASERFEEGWLLIPKSAGTHPAVLVPFYEPETSIGMGDKEHRDYARKLAERGFVTLAIGSPGGDARKPDPRKEGWQPLSFLAYVAANCGNALCALPEVDGRRLGIVGHSYGGKWAMFSACLNERFVCAAWSDPGIGFDDTRPSINYWEPWYLGRVEGTQRTPGIPSPSNPLTGPYKTLRTQGHDLHELQALMAPRPFFVSGGSEDPPERWKLLNHVRDVYAELGFQNRVGMHNRPAHPPTEDAMEKVCDFFEHFLKHAP